MVLDPALSLAGLAVGFIVGLTGMGGGALMTPVLILLFGINPMTAVSSDLVVSLFLKPVGGGVHWRRGTVRLDLVRWLCLGSVPSAIAGVLFLNALGPDSVTGLLKRTLGVALLASAAALLLRRRLLRSRPEVQKELVVRPLPTVLIGAVGGLFVGLTSVGSGSLIIVALLVLYPSLSPSSLVGTDLVQAVPLVGAAALGHLLFGSVELALTTALLIGGIPGVFVGARLSSRAPEGVVRTALVTVFVGTGTSPPLLARSSSLTPRGTSSTPETWSPARRPPTWPSFSSTPAAAPSSNRADTPTCRASWASATSSLPSTRWI